MKSRSPIDIVVLCNRFDVYLTRICVASIRYYYPDVPVYLVKDEVNGAFSTTDLEKSFDVQLLDLGLRHYGYCTGKIAVLLAEKLKGRKVLLMDSDIVFVGKVLDKLIPELADADFIVSPEWGNDPNTAWFSRTYYDPKWALQEFSEEPFPGFTFNAGQMVVTPGKLTPEALSDFVDLGTFPYWTDKANTHLPCRDQSLLNMLLPLKSKRGELRLKPVEFYLWSESKKVKEELSLERIAGEGYPFMIHWAGALRVPNLGRMTRSDILRFFESEYYERLPLGGLRKVAAKQYRFASDNISRRARAVGRRLLRR